jgi:DNA-binding response OmpR family regulator
MDDLNLNDIRLVLADPRLGIRNSLRMALNEAGFRNENIRDGANASLITEALSDGFNPDVVVCDNDVRDGDLSRLISAIRHGEVGSDPFVAIIAISWKGTMETVNDILGTGADFIVVAPFSPRQLLQRIRSLVYNRKKFVVTPDYVGPERGAVTGHPVRESLVLIEAPNSLRAKAVGAWDPDAYRESVNAALSTVNDRKLSQHAHQLSALAEQLSVDFAARGRAIDMDQLGRLVASAEDLLVHSTRSGLSHVAELSGAVKSVLTDIRRADAGAPTKQVELLRHLANAVRKAVTVSDRTAATVQGIATTVKTRSAIGQR